MNIFEFKALTESNNSGYCDKPRPYYDIYTHPITNPNRLYTAEELKQIWTEYNTPYLSRYLNEVCYPPQYQNETSCPQYQNECFGLYSHNKLYDYQYDSDNTDSFKLDFK